MGKINNAGLALIANCMAYHTQFNIMWMGLGDQDKETYPGAETVMTHMRWHALLERVCVESGSRAV